MSIKYSTKGLILAVTGAFMLQSGTTQAQISPYCPFLGPVFPIAKDVLANSTAVPAALRGLQDTIESYLQNSSRPGTGASFYLNAFTADQTIFDFGFVDSLLNASLTSGKLDKNTLFRIGSVSKLVTVYTLLAEVGMAHMNDPVTKWIPELSSRSSKRGRTSIREVRWDEVTIGALAGQISGINRDLSFGDLSIAVAPYPDLVKQAGLPVIPAEDLPKCGIDTGTYLLPCSRQDFFRDLQTLRPVASTSHTPIYSNIAFQILAYALEGITKNPFGDSLQSKLLKPLNLTRTFLEPPLNADNAIIPENETVSWWNVSTGGGSPASFGGIFSTPHDLAALGQSILKSSILKPSVTRAWLRTVSNTADFRISVGMPWEIRRILLPLSPGSKNNRIVDLYTKNGRIGLYTSLIVLSPDHGMGFTLLLTSTVDQAAVQGALLGVLGTLLTNTLPPAFEAAAREQAMANFGGEYTNANTTMTLTITVDEGLPGISVKNWTMGQLDVLKSYAGSLADYSLRLYPMDLEDGSEARFRGVYEPVRPTPTKACASDGGAFVGGCWSWGGVGAIQYGNIAFDDFEFTVDARGKAVAITPRVSGQTLSRVR